MCVCGWVSAGRRACEHRGCRGRGVAGAEGQEKIGQMRELVKSSGRDPDSVGIEGRINYGSGNADEWNKLAAAWDESGATHLSVNTMKSGLKGPDEHIEAIRRFKEAIS